MSKKEQWIQLVVVRVPENSHDAYLYRAPRFMCDPGDIVLVNFGGTRQGKVLMTINGDISSEHKRDEVMDIVRAFDARWPLQPVEGVLITKNPSWDEDDWTPEDDLEKEKEESDDAVRPD